jgi:hypothetical protein
MLLPHERSLQPGLVGAGLIVPVAGLDGRAFCGHGPAFGFATLIRSDVMHPSRVNARALPLAQQRRPGPVFFVLVNDTHLLSTVHCVDEEVIE